MRKQLLGIFSGFPDHHFPEEIADRIRKELPVRKSLVFISAWPDEHERNVEDRDGMHAMFAEKDMPFDSVCVIDSVTDSAEAKRLISEADCIFLMGGNATAQITLIREKELAEAITDSYAVILGVSAGAMNMAKYVVDIWESMTPYEGLGLENITIISHYDPSDTERLDKTVRASMDHTVFAPEDESAIFVKEGKIETVGNIFRVDKGETAPLSEDDIKEMMQDEFRKVFDTIPDQFDEFRPRYSDELFEYLIKEAQIGPGKMVLEIGPGTGQATDPILDTGCEYHAIELGEHLYRKMKEKYGSRSNFNIVNDDFITHDFGDMKFDMIYSAATIQWIPEDIAFSKTFSLLKPGGTLAMMLTTSEYRSNNEELWQRIQALYDRYYKPDIPYTHGGFNYTAATEYGYNIVEKREFKGRREFTADQYVAFSGTHCDHIVIPEPLKEEFFEGLRRAVQDAGDMITFNDTYVLYLTRRP